MHTRNATRLPLTWCTIHCACDDAPSSPCQQAALHTDTQDGPLTTSAEQDRTGQDRTGRDGTRHQTPPFCRQRSSSPRTRGHDPHDVDIGWAESAVNRPRLTVDGLGRVAPASASPQTWTNGRWCAVMGTWAPELQPGPRSPFDPRLRDGSTRSTPCLGQPGTNWRRAGTTLHDSPGVGPSASSGSEAVVGADGPDGVRHGEFRPSRRFCWHSAQLACAARLRRCGFENGKGGGSPNIMFVPEATTNPPN